MRRSIFASKKLNLRSKSLVKHINLIVGTKLQSNLRLVPDEVKNQIQVFCIKKLNLRSKSMASKKATVFYSCHQQSHCFCDLAGVEGFEPSNVRVRI